MASRIAYFKVHGANGLALASDVTDSLASKANSSDVTDALALKADASDLALKADATDLTGLASSANVYSKTEADGLLANKLESADIANKLEASDIADKVDSSYLGQVVNDINDALGNRAQVNSVYTITSMDALLSDKLDASVHSSRVTAENNFIEALKDALFVESAPGSGSEYVYTDLLGA
jgi:hypothetical protein